MTPSPQEATKWAEIKADEVLREAITKVRSFSAQAGLNVVAAALLDADKNGYERGRKEAIEAAAKIVEDAIPMSLCGGKAARDKLMGFGVILFRLRDSIKALAPSVSVSEGKP